MNIVKINTYKESGKWYDELIYTTGLNPVDNEKDFFEEIKRNMPQVNDMNHTINCEYKISQGRTALYHRLIIKNK